MIAEYNNYSKELLAYLKQHRPKPGQTVIFEAIGKKLNAGKDKPPVLPEFSILAHDTIYDFGKEDFIKIANITATIPVSNPDSKKDFQHVYTKPSFSRSAWSQIKLRGDNPEDVAVFDYLFLCRWFAGNKGKKGYDKAPLSGYQFVLLNPEKDAQKVIEHDQAVRAAKDYIDKMSSAEKRSLARAFGYANAENDKAYSDAQIHTFLYKKANESPEKIEFNAKAARTEGLDFAASLLKAGIIEVEGTGKEKKIVDAVTKEPICAIVKGNAEESFFEYLSAKGKDVKEAYMNALLAKE